MSDRAILICDDEADIRAAMRRTLRGFLVTEASSVPEAFAILRDREFDAVVSDFSLGDGRDGLEILQFARVSQPNTIRFLVTGNTDVHVAIRAVNEGAVHRYFLKPWNDDQLRYALQLELHRHMPAPGSTP
ncbi:MAG: response regulator [Deltaproteobacteria bacterium]|nr:response regulator [Deltaproteobacteria bacterium]